PPMVQAPAAVAPPPRLDAPAPVAAPALVTPHPTNQVPAAPPSPMGVVPNLTTPMTAPVQADALPHEEPKTNGATADGVNSPWLHQPAPAPAPVYTPP